MPARPRGRPWRGAGGRRRGGPTGGLSDGAGSGRAGIYKMLRGWRGGVMNSGRGPSANFDAVLEELSLPGDVDGASRVGSVGWVEFGGAWGRGLKQLVDGYSS